MYLVYRTETFAKLFFIVSFTGLFMYVALAFYSFHTAYSTVSQIPDIFSKKLKYILLWTVSNESNIPEGETLFLNDECPEIGCYITTNKNLLNMNYTNFDAIIFNQSIQVDWERDHLPIYRSPRQKYVFYSKLASSDNPICIYTLDNFVNWTFTYKFNSDIFSPFIEVKDYEGNLVAPRKDVVWSNYDQPLTEFVDNIEMNAKTKAVIWIMNDCSPRAKTILSLERLQKALEEKFLVLDIYGCGNLECPAGGCLQTVQKDYYFYLAYEHSISEDYVTDEVLKAYHYDAVPIVVGGADYSKFLPDKSYINFREFTEETLAASLAYIISAPSRYREYFNWKKLYTINKVDQRRDFCQICTLLHNKKFDTYSTYENFRKWWFSGSLGTKCFLSGMRTLTEMQKDFNTTTKHDLSLSNVI